MEKMKLNIQLFGTWGADAAFDKKLYGQVGYSNVTRNGNTITVTWGSRVKSNYGTFNYGMGGCSYWKLGSSTGGNTTKYYGKGSSGSYKSGRWYYTNNGNTSKSASVTGERYDFTATTTVSSPAAGSITLESWVWTYDSTSGYANNAYPTVSVSYPAAASVTVTFDADGGLGGPTSQTFYKGYSGTLTSDEPYKTGYTFAGWYTSPGKQGTKYNSGGVYTFNSNITLYAGWDINSYWNDINALQPDGTTQNGLMFDLYTSDGGEWLNITNEPTSFTKEYYTQAVIENIRPNVTGAHYTGNSVSSSMDRIEWYFTTANYSVNLYSAWNTYTVVYNANGGVGTTGSSSHVYNTDKNLTLNGFIRSGYDFLGWSTDPSAITPTYTNGQSVKNLTTVNNGTVTLYAVWRVTAPSNVRFTSAAATGPFNINLVWTCTGLNITNYTIYYKKAEASTYSSMNCGTSTSLSLAVDEETTYDIYITATNAGGTAQSGVIQITTPADQAKVRIYTGNAWIQGKTWIYTGSTWIKAKKVYIYDGNQWKINSNN